MVWLTGETYYRKAFGERGHRQKCSGSAALESRGGRRFWFCSWGFKSLGSPSSLCCLSGRVWWQNLALWSLVTGCDASGTQMWVVILRSWELRTLIFHHAVAELSLPQSLPTLPPAPQQGTWPTSANRLLQIDLCLSVCYTILRWCAYFSGFLNKM